MAGNVTLIIREYDKDPAGIMSMGDDPPKLLADPIARLSSPFVPDKNMTIVLETGRYLIHDAEWTFTATGLTVELRVYRQRAQ